MTTGSLADCLALIESGRMKEAAARLVRLARSMPDNLPVRYVLGHALEELEHWTEAAQVWKEAIRLANGMTVAEPSPVSTQNISVLHHDLADLADVGDIEEHGIEVEFVTPTYAKVLASQGVYAEAADVYEQLATSRPNQASEYRERAAQIRKLAQDSP